MPPVNEAHNRGAVEVNGEDNGDGRGGNGDGIMGENEVPVRQPDESRRRDRAMGAGGEISFHPDTTHVEAASTGNADAHPWEGSMCAMQAQIHGVLAAVRDPDVVDDVDSDGDSPFSQAVMARPLPSKFKMPALDLFDGSKDPFDYLETYKILMYIHTYPDEIMCHVFPVTLKGLARLWFNKIKPGTISSFPQLDKMFVGYFITGKRQRKPATHIITIK